MQGLKVTKFLHLICDREKSCFKARLQLGNPVSKQLFFVCIINAIMWKIRGKLERKDDNIETAIVYH